MKHIILLLITMFMFTATFAQFANPNQKYILKVGGNGYFTLITPPQPPQDYNRGYVATQWTIRGQDTLLSLIYNFGPPITLVQPTIDTNWQNGDSSSTNFPSVDSLYGWTRRNLLKSQ